MGTGIVSLALWFDAQLMLSRIWLALAAAECLVLGLFALRPLARNPRLLVHLARSPASLTSVAATAVVGAGLHTVGWRFASAALLAAAALLWTGVSAVLITRGRLPRTGSSFMLTVSVQSLAGLAALNAGPADEWLTFVAIVLSALGLALYPLVLWRFDRRELHAGPGDHWIAGGALAISSLTVGEIALAASRQPAVHSIAGTAGDVAGAIWIASMLWLPALLMAEVRSRRLGYHLRRWSTLFPVGMYAASGFEVARVAGLHAAGSFARIWLWAAVAMSLILTIGLVQRALPVATGERVAAPRTRAGSAPSRRRAAGRRSPS